MATGAKGLLQLAAAWPSAHFFGHTHKVDARRNGPHADQLVVSELVVGGVAVKVAAHASKLPHIEVRSVHIDGEVPPPVDLVWLQGRAQLCFASQSRRRLEQEATQ
jgi:hypothetical protein